MLRCGGGGVVIVGLWRVWLWVSVWRRASGVGAGGRRGVRGGGYGDEGECAGEVCGGEGCFRALTSHFPHRVMVCFHNLPDRFIVVKWVEFIT